jgi:hypothetical protein
MAAHGFASANISYPVKIASFSRSQPPGYKARVKARGPKLCHRHVFEGLNVKKISLLVSWVGLCCVAAGSAEAEEATVIAKAQFPAPHSAETDREWACYVTAYHIRYHMVEVPRFTSVTPLVARDLEAKTPPLQPPAPVFVPGPVAPEPYCNKNYADLDAEGRPIWFDGYAAEGLITLAASLMTQEKFADLDRLIEDWTSRQERTADGRWKLSLLLDAIGNQQAIGSERMKEWIQRWKAANPTSPGAAIAEANHLLYLAGKARGQGWASTVTPEGWKLLEERLQKAEQTLLESKSYASKNPVWGRLYLEVAALLNWPRKSQFELYQEITKSHPYYNGAYSSYIRFLVPRWGGDWKLVDAAIKDAEKKTRATDGAAMYTRMYAYITQIEDVGFNIFTDAYADWPHMKQGFKDLSKLYPHSAYNANHYAAFACLAKDGESFWDARSHIGNRIMEGVWPSNLSVDVCEARFPGHAL